MSVDLGPRWSYDMVDWLHQQKGMFSHDDVTKWKHFPRYWPFVRRIHRWSVNSPHKGQWCGGLMFSLICAWTNGWVNNRDTGDLRCYRAQHDVTIMTFPCPNIKLQDAWSKWEFDQFLMRCIIAKIFYINRYLKWSVATDSGVLV